VDKFGTAVLLHVDKYWDNSIATCGYVLGQQYNYMWRSTGKALQ